MPKNTIKSIILNKKSIALKIYFVLITISILLLSDKELFFSISLQRYPALDTIISIFLIVFGAIFMHKRSLKIDYISMLLFARMSFSLVTAMLVSASPYATVKAICVFVAALFGYNVFLNKSKDIRDGEFSTLISIYLLIISIQTIGLYLVNFIKLSVVSKSIIEIPIGKSNLIATHVLICIIFLYSNDFKNIFKSITLVMGLVSLIISFSFGALISLFSVLIIKNVLFQKHIKMRHIIGIIILVLMLFYMIFVYYPNYNFNNSILLNIYTNISIKINYFLMGNYERLFSDRFVLYEESWRKFTDSPIFGSFEGLNFRGRDNYRSHNLFLEALSSYGIVGFLTLILPLYGVMNKILKFIKRNREFNIIMTCFLALVAGIIHGLVEPNFFSLEYEFLWWSIAGFAISRVKSINKKI